MGWWVLRRAFLLDLGLGRLMGSYFVVVVLVNGSGGVVIEGGSLAVFSLLPYAPSL